MLSQAKLLPVARLNLVCATLFVTGSKQTMNTRKKQI